MSQVQLIGLRRAVGPGYTQSGMATAMDWALLLIFLISAFAAGEMARARRRSVYAWVGWATIIGPLALVLLLAVGPKKRTNEIRISS